ncbi:MAG: AN1-type zinc finger domain-containing protein [Promethearchaeota archaeon]
MVQKKCFYCGDNSYILFPCSECGNSFCAIHRLPENHECPSLANGSANIYIQPGQAEPVVNESIPPSPYQGSPYGNLPAANTDDVSEYVWEPSVVELPDDPFDPKSGVLIRGIFLPRLNETVHIVIAFIIMFFIGFLISRSIFSGSGLDAIPTFTNNEKNLFPIYLASMSTSGFLIHEFSHRQVGRKYQLPAKFRLLTMGMLITIIGVVGYLATMNQAFQIPPFAIPGAVVVIGLENRDQAGKCKIAGPLSNLIITCVLLPLTFLFDKLFGFEYFILFLLGAYMNTFLGFFNMLPVGLLDGAQILKWKKWAWLSLFLTLLGLLIFELTCMTNLTNWYHLLGHS